MAQTRFAPLTALLEEVNAAVSAAAALYDYQTGQSWSFDGARSFHAASTIKIAVLACTYAVLHERGLTPSELLQVRNHFFSVVDGSPFETLPSRDTDRSVYAAIGRTMRISDLASRMITVSSNLATNNLVDFVGLPAARRILAQANIRGVDLMRGVEDDRAFDAGISNRVTADGLVHLLRAIVDGRFGSAEYADEMIGILSAQASNSGIPAGLPPAVRATARVAHKTGEISSVTHDAGVVFTADHPPFVLAVLTGTGPNAGNRFAPIARVSARAFELITR